jgi:hypothetical protein
MELPNVYILIVTYDRPKEIRRTLFGLLKQIKYPREKTLWHLADDSSPGTYLDDIKADFKALRFTTTVTDRKGWGANVNKAQVFCFSKTPYVFLIEDDYVAQRPIDLERGVALLASKSDRHRPSEATKRRPIGLVRYDGIEAHWLKLELREAETGIGPVHYMRILCNSPFLNVYSHRPHLKVDSFHVQNGAYPEGLPLGETESAFAHRVKNNPNGPWVCVLSDGVEKSFDHIGKSRQNTELDIQG